MSKYGLFSEVQMMDAVAGDRTEQEEKWKKMWSGSFDSSPRLFLGGVCQQSVGSGAESGSSRGKEGIVF